MRIKAKNGETMFWVKKYREMIEFKDDIANVSDKIGKEMISNGYKQEGTVTVSTPKRVVTPKE